MKRLQRILAVATASLLLSTGIALAQDHQDDRDHHGSQDQHGYDQGHDHGNGHGNGHAYGHDYAHHYVHHNDWRRGGHIGRNDWDRGERIDYRHYRLRRPPRGYEWREVDGNYVLAALASGLIASVIIASQTH